MGVPPEILRQVKLIELRTRGLVNSVFTGEYRSVFRGHLLLSPCCLASIPQVRSRGRSRGSSPAGRVGSHSNNGNVGDRRLVSSASNERLRSRPPPYPVRFPLAPITR